MAQATHTQFSEVDFARARWLIEIFDEACRDLPDQPSEEQRKILAAAVIQAAELYGCRDRAKLKDAALKYLREAGCVLRQESAATCVSQRRPGA